MSMAPTPEESARVVVIRCTHGNWYAHDTSRHGGACEACIVAALAAKREKRPGDMTCEAHPGKPWPHDDCPGPGMPWTALERIVADLVAALRDRAKQAHYMTIEAFRGIKPKSGTEPHAGMFDGCPAPKCVEARIPASAAEETKNA